MQTCLYRAEIFRAGYNTGSFISLNLCIVAASIPCPYGHRTEFVIKRIERISHHKIAHHVAHTERIRNFVCFVYIARDEEHASARVTTSDRATYTSLKRICNWNTMRYSCYPMPVVPPAYYRICLRGIIIILKSIRGFINRWFFVQSVIIHTRTRRILFHPGKRFIPVIFWATAIFCSC